jgi:hypothetical protein
MQAILPASVHGANKHSSYAKNLLRAKGALSFKALGQRPRFEVVQTWLCAESAIQVNHLIE